MRLIPSESDSSPAAPSQPSAPPVAPTGTDHTVPTDQTDAAPPVGGTVAEPALVAPVDVESAIPEQATVPDSRVALREARRVRRRTAWLCVAVVAVALALTIVVVSLARIRPIPQSSAAVTTAVTVHILVPSVPTPGATAPEGGTP